MQLTVIGCSPAWPDPGGAHAGYLVEAGGTRLLLDCGPGVLSRLRREGPLDIDAIAITHLHLDHWGDLVPWVFLRLHHERDAKRPSLVVHSGALVELDAFGSHFGRAGMFGAAFDVVEYQDRRPFAVGPLELEPVSVEHYGMAAFGFRISDEAGRLLAYSGDSGPCDGLTEIAAGADLFLCEATLRNGADDSTPRGHLSAEEALGYANGRVLLTHRPVEFSTPDGVERAVEGLRVEI